MTDTRMSPKSYPLLPGQTSHKLLAVYFLYAQNSKIPTPFGVRGKTLISFWMQAFTQQQQPPRICSAHTLDITVI